MEKDAAKIRSAHLAANRYFILGRCDFSVFREKTRLFPSLQLPPAPSTFFPACSLSAPNAGPAPNNGAAD